MAHSLRSLGSAALNYGMVASGSLDLYWYPNSSESVFVFILLTTYVHAGRLVAGEW